VEITGADVVALRELYGCETFSMSGKEQAIESCA
jgi:hypothetical protein